MKIRNAPDHLAGSLTDLMTSLAVIFILLLVAKLNNQATWTDRSLKYVKTQLEDKRLFQEGEKIRSVGDVLIVAIPHQLMSFKQARAEQGGADLSSQGRDYLRSRIPELASVVCRSDVRKKIDTILVEGHSDRKGFGMGSEEADERENLKLSQERSMAVVSEALNTLDKDRSCFLELLSASGRGDAHPLNVQDLYSPENRRVELRIRIKPDITTAVSNALGSSAKVREDSK